MAVKTGDVMFTITLTDYNYMLAVAGDGRKRWEAKQLAWQAPSLVKTKIDCVILAKVKMRQADGTVIATRDITTVLAELRTIADAVAEVTFDGFDDETYMVLLDPTATSVSASRDETGRLTQYEIAISCWDLYQAA